MWKNVKLASKRCPNGVGNFGGGASWGTFGAPVRFLTRKMWPKSCKGDAKVAKLTPKVVPKLQKWLKNRAARSHFMVDPLNAARARRTAPSAFNKEERSDQIDAVTRTPRNGPIAICFKSAGSLQLAAHSCQLAAASCTGSKASHITYTEIEIPGSSELTNIAANSNDNAEW